tara:strand:- start:245 stop:526 length:282 start_codon:yes stop_codon:yes gene_type:complete
MPATRRISRPEIAATALGWDMADMSHALYHYGHTGAPVWSVGDGYLTVATPKELARVAKYLHGIAADWTEYPDRRSQLMAAVSGRRVYVRKEG